MRIPSQNMELRKRKSSKDAPVKMEYDEKHSRYISIKTKRDVIQRQMGRCNNTPFSPALPQYPCPFWKWNYGLVDSSGMEFDHIEEWILTKDNTSKNIQGLCVCCHKMKTSLFMKSGKEFTTAEIMNGKARMEVDPPALPPAKKTKLA